MKRNSQRLPVRGHYDSRLPLVKKADCLKSAVGFVLFFALRQSVIMTVWRGAFILLSDKRNFYIMISRNPE